MKSSAFPHVPFLFFFLLDLLVTRVLGLVSLDRTVFPGPISNSLAEKVIPNPRSQGVVITVLL